ncbi:MAG: hypothetical protein FJ222_04960 [Lentisphaerae bacterium]|nr:hypothetical protein [Lentisphaerota bacterium]
MTAPTHDDTRPALPGGLLQQAIEATPAWRRLPIQAHTPDFHLVSFPPAPHAAGSDWYWIYDGAHKIGLIQTWNKELEMFRFSPPAADETVDYTIPPVHHWATLVGAKISINAPLWETPNPAFQIEFVSRAGPVLEFKTVTKLDGGSVGEGTFRLAWDTRLGYVWQCGMHCTMPDPKWTEFCNLLAGGVSVSHHSRKRWQKVINGVSSGKTTWFYHNPLNYPRVSLASNGFTGFVREPGMNPFVALESVNGPVRMATCDLWYDLGIQSEAPATAEADGMHHLRASYRFLSVPDPVAETLEQQAESQNAGKSDVPGFRFGVVNDFEQGINGGEVYNGSTWRHVTVDRTRGHSGSVSLKVSGKGRGAPAVGTPNRSGTATYGETAKHYRLSVWVRTALTDGEASIAVDDCIWNWDDVRATRRSAGITGTTDWTKLTLEFQPSADNPFLLVKLCVDGTGDAWFDDCELVEMP